MWYSSDSSPLMTVSLCYLCNPVLTPTTGHSPRSSSESFRLPYLQGKGREGKKEGAGGLYSRTDHVLVCAWGRDFCMIKKGHFYTTLPTLLNVSSLCCCFLVSWPWFSGSPPPPPQPFLSLVHFERIMRGTTIIVEFPLNNRGKLWLC